MKRSILILFAAVMVFTACNDDDGYDTYFRKLGNFEVLTDTPNDFQIVLDNGDIVTPEEVSGDYSSVEDGERVVVYFTPISEQVGANGITIFSSAIHGMDYVLNKDVFTLTSEIADSIGNDPIHVHSDDIWFSKNYLNVYFSYYGYNQVHYINMVKFENDSIDAERNLILEFRHNANSDFYGYGYSDLVSFDMNSLLQPGIDSIPVSVRVTDYDGKTLIWKDTYYSNNESLETRNLSYKVSGHFVK